MVQGGIQGHILRQSRREKRSKTVLEKRERPERQPPELFTSALEPRVHRPIKLGKTENVLGIRAVFPKREN